MLPLLVIYAMWRACQQYSNQQQLIGGMQLSKAFNFDENSLFNQHPLRQEPFDRQSASPSAPQHSPSSGMHPLPDREVEAKELKFFQEYKKIYNVSYHLYLEKLRLLDLHRQAVKKIALLEDRLRDREEKEQKKTEVVSSQENKMKRSRRTAEMIEKRFRCNVPFCERWYGSEGSLQQHIKLKHPQLYRAPENTSQAFSEDVDGQDSL